MEIQDILEQVVKDIKTFQIQNQDWIVIIRWATATGKSKLSTMLADFFDIEIISADSRQIFRYMDIGTDKVTEKIRKKIKHHQIDIIDPKETYTAWQRKDDTEKLMEKIIKKWKLPIIVWWTWLYIDTIYKNFSMPACPPDYKLRKKLENQETRNSWYLHKQLLKIDSQEASKLHPNSIRFIIRALEIYKKTWKTKTESYLQSEPKRPILMIWLRREKEDTNKRIDIRIKEMIKSWLIEEVRWLLKKWYWQELQSMQWIGYKETIEYLEWKYNLDQLEENLRKNTHYLAKKQRTRFRRYIAEWNSKLRKNIDYKLYML
jgi:tRNA dimethylallyltransferase